MIILALMAGLYLFLIAPGTGGKDFSPFLGRMYAHRGLFDNAGGVPENSLAAFRGALEAGYGIELDVRLARDGIPVVFHDPDLARLCGAQIPIADLMMEELPQYRLLNTRETIPLFSEVLELVDGRVPLIVEIKHGPNALALAQAVRKVLSEYSGPYCVESFHPLILRWFKRNAPEVIRGQPASGRLDGEAPRLPGLALKYLLVNGLSRPDFIAYDFRMDRNLSMLLLRRAFKVPLAAWTVRSPAERDQAAGRYSLQIFEGFKPER